MKHSFVYPLLFTVSSNAFAASEITHLSVNEQTVRFAIGEAKTHQLPSCVQSQTKNYYNFSLESEVGRAMYSLLITAVSSQLPVTVESANDCMVEPTIERAKGVAFAPKPRSADGYKGITMIYKGDGVTKVGRFVSYNGGAGWSIIRPGDNQHFVNFRSAGAFANTRLFFLGKDCKEQAVVNSPSQWIANPYYESGRYFKTIESSRKRVTINSYLLKDGRCLKDSFPMDGYELEPTTHPFCDDKPCILRDE